MSEATATHNLGEATTTDNVEVTASDNVDVTATDNVEATATDNIRKSQSQEIPRSATATDNMGKLTASVSKKPTHARIKKQNTVPFKNQNSDTFKTQTHARIKRHNTMPATKHTVAMAMLEKTHGKKREKKGRPAALNLKKKIFTCWRGKFLDIEAQEHAARHREVVARESRCLLAEIVRESTERARTLLVVDDRGSAKRAAVSRKGRPASA